MASLLSLRQCNAFPRFARTVVNRASLRPTPAAREGVSTPADFLTAIGRDAETKVNAESWDELWKLNGHELKKAGLAVKDRRYILWCMEKFRQGAAPSEYAHPAQPKKKIRGWGPAVQNGKTIRSRR